MTSKKLVDQRNRDKITVMKRLHQLANGENATFNKYIQQTIGNLYLSMQKKEGLDLNIFGISKFEIFKKKSLANFRLMVVQLLRRKIPE
jgi:hypothetical protein